MHSACNAHKKEADQKEPLHSSPGPGVRAGIGRVLLPDRSTTLRKGDEKTRPHPSGSMQRRPKFDTDSNTDPGRQTEGRHRRPKSDPSTARRSERPVPGNADRFTALTTIQTDGRSVSLILSPTDNRAATILKNSTPANSCYPQMSTTAISECPQRQVGNVRHERCPVPRGGGLRPGIEPPFAC